MKFGTLIENVVRTDNQVLWAEEALYLLEKRKLTIFKHGEEWTFGQALEHFQLHKDIYLVYSMLKQKGFVLKRASIDREMYECLSVRGIQLSPSSPPHYKVYKNPQNAKKGMIAFKLLIITGDFCQFDFSIIPDDSLRICFVKEDKVQFLHVNKSNE